MMCEYSGTILMALQGGFLHFKLGFLWYHGFKTKNFKAREGQTLHAPI